MISFEHINVNGLSTKNDMYEIDEVLGTLKDMEAGVFSLNEHTLNTAKPTVMKKLWESSRRIDPYAKLSVASCTKDKSDSTWKPGGTLLGVAGRWASRVMNQGSDPLGRWSWMELRGKAGMVLRVYSAYRVCQEKVENAGVLTACHQQYRALVKAKHKIVSPRQAFLADLEHELLVWG